MKRVAAILVWGILLWGTGTFLDEVRLIIMIGGDPATAYIVRFGFGLGLAIIIVLASRWFSPRMLKTGDWFMAGIVAWLAQGGYVLALGEAIGAGRTFDIQIHDTYYVIAHVHVIAGVVLLYALMALIYYAGHGMNRVLGNVHFFVTHAALFVLFWMKFFNPAYQVRGYLEWHEYYQSYAVVDKAYAVMALLLVAAQALFVVNLFLMALGSRTRRTR